MYWYKNTPDSLGYEAYQKSRSGTGLIRRSFVRYFFLLLVIVFVYVILKGFYYIDLSNHCFVKVKYDVLKGDRESIKEALAEIKNSDYVFYRNFCAYIDTVYEKRCVIPVENNPRKLKFTGTEGCYIKGSKAIIINPISKNNYQKVDLRKTALKKYGQIAIDYWTEGKLPPEFEEKVNESTQSEGSN